MKWITATDLDRWADTHGSRIELSELVSSLVRATASEINYFRFLTGDSAQIHGYDGTLVARGMPPYVPDGHSVWEFGTDSDYIGKANEDYKHRSEKPGVVTPSENTFVFVTPRPWARTKPSLPQWEQEKSSENVWKNVQAIDGVKLEAWLEDCPAVAARFARDILGLMPETGVRSTDEFWDEFASRFKPALCEDVLLCGRKKETADLLPQLMGPPGSYLLRADSPEEVLAFAVASIRKADPEVRKYLEARTLVVDFQEAARRLVRRRNLTFLVLPAVGVSSGALSSYGPVLVPVAREDSRGDSSAVLKRPTTHDMGQALMLMGFSQEAATQLARKAGRSVTVLARQIPSAASAPRPEWAKDPDLVPALLLGAWNAEAPDDCNIVREVAGCSTYEEYEARLRKYLKTTDSPLEREGSVWHLLAPVDAFVHLAYLIGKEHIDRLTSVFQKVFSEHDPSLDLSPEERPYAALSGKKLKHSSWLRDGLATTALLFAALEEGADLRVTGGAQAYVNRLAQSLPGLQNDWRVLASLEQQLPLLMEAAPRPLAEALKHMLGGDENSIRPIFRDTDAIFSSSPHTGLLWALEVMAWDPEYLSRVSLILARLAKVDPGGKLSNRPIESLRAIFLPWLPNTNAALPRRLAALDNIITNEPTVGWQLVLKLLPEHHSIGHHTATPRFREAGGSEKEIITNLLVWQTYTQIIDRALLLVGQDSERWTAIIEAMQTFSPEQRERALRLLEQFSASASQAQRTIVWTALRDLVNHHRAFRSAAWSMKEEELQKLDSIVAQLEPSDAITKVGWLFDEYHPRFPDGDPNKSLEAMEGARKAAVQQVYETGKNDSVIALADAVKLPRFVGFSAAGVINDFQGIDDLLDRAFEKGAKLDEFVIALSLAADQRHGEPWRTHVSRRANERRWTPEQISILLLWWKDDPETWRFVASLGTDVERRFWERKPVWPVSDDSTTLEMAARKYLTVGRAVSALEILYRGAKTVASEVLFETLDQALRELNSASANVSTMLVFELETILSALGERNDVPIIEVAKREYAYLPLLTHGDRSLILHRLMSTDPDFFVSVLCDAFRPAGGEATEPDEERKRRARAAYQLLSRLNTVPGVGGSDVDGVVLKDWIIGVRESARRLDRAKIADEYIGHILAHSPESGGNWPHPAVNEVLETLKSDAVERGILIERHNMRGVFAKAMYEGGDQERGFATQAASWAKAAVNWPRTHDMLLRLSLDWNEAAKREDERARQDEMKFEQ